jgi:hypothetical protein
MILFGFSCPVCKSSVIDSVTECPSCGEPYKGLLAQTAKAHHEAKLAMVAGVSTKPLSEERALADVSHLAASSKSIALLQTSGVMTLSDRLLADIFKKDTFV